LRVFNATKPDAQRRRPKARASCRSGLRWRLKKALIPMLQSGKPISGVFEDVLGEKGQLHSKDQFLSGRKKSGTSSGSSLS